MHLQFTDTLLRSMRIDGESDIESKNTSLRSIARKAKLEIAGTRIETVISKLQENTPPAIASRASFKLQYLV